jgi:hypothetical protein
MSSIIKTLSAIVRRTQKILAKQEGIYFILLNLARIMFLRG